jgi:hypothetical protein
MKKLLTITVFLLATLAWAVAQQSGTGQAGSPGSMPGASQSQQQMPGSAPGMQAGSRDPAADAPVIEGCLGGSAPNFTVTDDSGTTYKLNIPPTADTSKLAAHVGESVEVQGNVTNTGRRTGSIDVQGIGRGTGTCPAGGSKSTPISPK